MTAAGASRLRLIIDVGTLASAQMVGIAQLKDAVGRVHGTTCAGRKFDVVVLPFDVAEQEQSLRLIREHPAMR